MPKVWEVEFGYNYTSKVVVAKNYREAVLRARKAEGHIPRGEDWIRKVEMIAEAV